MKNTVSLVQSNSLDISILHMEDSERYELGTDEKYRLRIKKSLTDGEECVRVYDSDGEYFSIDTSDLECGSYYFEISLVDKWGDEFVISPATDINGDCSNTLIITERL